METEVLEPGEGVSEELLEAQIVAQAITELQEIQAPTSQVRFRHNANMCNRHFVTVFLCHWLFLLKCVFFQQYFNLSEDNKGLCIPINV